MKKLLGLVLVATLVVACNNEADSSKGEVDTTIIDTAILVEDTAVFVLDSTLQEDGTYKVDTVWEK